MTPTAKKVWICIAADGVLLATFGVLTRSWLATVVCWAFLTGPATWLLWPLLSRRRGARRASPR